MRVVTRMPSDHDNRLALGQFIDRCERLRLAWVAAHGPFRHTPELRYEVRLLDSEARGTYRGRTATHAATKAMDAMDALRIGWEDSDRAA